MLNYKTKMARGRRVITFIKFLLMCFFGGVSILSGLLSVAYAADLLSKYIQVVINTLVK